MEHSEKILQLLHSNDPKNVELAMSLAQSLSKQGFNTDFVIHELFQCQLPLCLCCLLHTHSSNSPAVNLKHPLNLGHG